MTQPDVPDWIWAERGTGEFSAHAEREAAKRFEAALPTIRANDIQRLQSDMGQAKLLQLMTGGAAHKVGNKIVGDKAAWSNARKALHSYLKSKRGTVNEPYKSRLAGLNLGKQIRVTMTIDARVSNKDKNLYPTNIVMAGGAADTLIQAAVSGDPNQAIYTTLKEWGGGLENLVVRIYEVSDIKIES